MVAQDSGGAGVRLALYARVSTHDKDQDPETQIHALVEYCNARGHQIAGKYVDAAPARDLRARHAWRELLTEGAKVGRRSFDGVLVFKLDRAWRSVKEMHDTLSAWEVTGVVFIAAREDFNTTTAYGRLFMNLLSSFAEFEGEGIRERVLAGLARARAQGKRLGRPRIDVPEAAKGPVLERVDVGAMTITAASKELGGVSRATVRRFLAEWRFAHETGPGT